MRYSLMHLQNIEGEYLCSNYMKSNPNKMSYNITKVNCKDCLKLIAENDFSRTELSINQTSLSGVIFCN